MKKTDELIKLPHTTMYFPKVELTKSEINQLYQIGHVVPSWLRHVIVNTDDLDDYLSEPPKRKSKTVALSEFVEKHLNDEPLLQDIKAFSNGELELIDLSVKYGIFYKDLRKVFQQCFPKHNIEVYWKRHKKHGQKKTSLALYGVKHTSQVPEIDKKRKDTMIKRYGVDHNMKSPILRKQFVDSMMEKHGVPYAFSNTAEQNKHIWIEKLFQTLIQDEKWQNVLNTIARENFWDYNEQLFDEHHLNINHRDFIISEKSTQRIEALLLQYYRITNHKIQYPTNIFFTLPVGVCFSKTWLRHFQQKGLIDVSDESLTTGLSKYESMLINLLSQADITFETNVRKPLDGLEMDFYFPQHQIGLELNPNVTHNSNDYATSASRQMYTSKKPKSYHYQKYITAKEKGITLIQWFGNDLEPSTLVNVSFPRLLSLLKGYQSRLYARQVQVQKLSVRQSKQARQFIDLYHSQHNTPASEYWGFYHNEQLVAAASFSINGNSAELKRLCFPPQLQIIGGLSKLIHHFFEEHCELSQVTSFSDNNLGNGHGYQQAGAILLSETGPSLKYISYSDPTDTYSWAVATTWGAKQGVIAKDNEGVPLQTISEIQEYVECQLSHRTDNKKGYDKIFTAGSKKWQFNKGDVL